MRLPGTTPTNRRKRIAAIALAVAVALGVATAVAVPLERAAVTASHAKHSKPVVMGAYPTAEYRAAAKEVPTGLRSALSRDLSLSPAEYLADGAAATQAVKVVAALKVKGVHVLGSSIHGTVLTVNVASNADVPSVRAVGATAVIGAPKKVRLPKGRLHTKDQTFPVTPSGQGSAEILGGDPYVFNDSDGDEFECSVGFNGFTTAGLREFVTAGHCATLISGSAYLAGGNGPNDNPSATNGSCGCDTIGSPVSGEGAFGSGTDYGVVTEPSEYVVGALADWGTRGTADSDPNTPTPGENIHPLYVTGESAAEQGAPLCKSGATSGWTCGVIWKVDSLQPVEDDNGNVFDINSIVATTCVLSGDSGGGAMSGSVAMGVASASTFPDAADDGDADGYPCGNSDPDGIPADSDYYSVFFPMVSVAGDQSVQGQLGNKWHIETAVQTPVVTSSAVVTSTSSVSGTLANPTPTSEVSAYLTTASGNVPWATVSAASGSWSIPLSGGLETSPYTFTLVAFDGFNTSRLAGFQIAVHSNCSPPTGYGPSVKVRSAGVGDFSCDGYNDVIARDSTGELWLYPGTGYAPAPNTTGTAAFGTPIALAAGWQGMTSIQPVGDFNGDQYPDVVARDGAGTEWLYPGNGHGFGARVQLAADWGAMTAIQGVGDFNNDGFADLVVRTKAGVVDLYPGTGSGLGTPVQLATGWQSMTAIVGIGDMNGDGIADLAARDAAGNLWLYPGTLSGSLGTRVQIGSGWQGLTVVAGGDFFHSSQAGLIARDSSGNLWLYPGNGSGGFGTRALLGVGWGGFTIAGDASSIKAILPPLSPLLSGGVGDFNSDGFQDLITRDSSGTLWLYPGNGSAGWLPRVQLATGWGSMTAIVSVGDLDGDGHPDVVARDGAGTLWLYPGNGNNGFGTPVQLATGWQSMTAIQGVADFNGDGHVDLLARDASGVLWLYPGTGSDTLGARVQVATGWQGFTSIVGVGDFNGDGHPDLLARDTSGNLWLYPGTGTGALQPRVQVGSGWGGFLISAIGDFNGDGTLDLLTRDPSGNLYLYPGDGSGGWLARVQVGSGWNGFTVAGDGASIKAVIPPPSPLVSGGVGDFNSDGFQDLITRDSAGVLWLYPGNGSAGWLPRVQLATGWQSMTAIVSVGDLNGDGHPDVVARDSAGVLWLYPGNGSNGFGSRVQLDPSFQSMTAIQGVGDFNGDGHPDLLARDSSGVVWLYPGTGSNTLGTRVQVTTGWQGFTSIVGAGDFNGDGHPDLITRDTSGNLFLYPGTGTGGISAGIQIGSGWGGFLISAIGDFNRDGTQDILARDTSGNLRLYPGNGSGGWLSTLTVGSGWQGFTVAGDGASVTASIPAAESGGVGDFNSDGNTDLITRDPSGVLWLYPGNGSASFGSRVQLATGWQQFNAIAAVGDLDGDGHPDVVARRASDGTLWLYPGNGSNGFGTAEQLTVPGTTWSTMTAIEGVADLNGDGHTDLLTRDASGNLLLFPGSGSTTNTLGAPVQIASGFAASTAIIGTGDFNGDGKSDIITRDSAGNLQLYPGTGTGTFGAATQIGSGWQGFSIAAIGDFNRDGAEDILSRDASGNLFLYPGNGHGGWLARVQVGSGWTGFSILGDGTVSALTG